MTAQYFGSPPWLTCSDSEMEFGAIVQLLQHPRHLELLIGMNPDTDAQADLWHFAAEIAENDTSIPEHLDSAIQYYQKANDLLSDSDDRKPIFLHHLGNAFLARAESGVSAEPDIRQAITAIEEGIKITSTQDEYYKIYIGNHGDAMFRLAQETKSRNDFAKGVVLMNQAIELAGADYPHRELWYGKLRTELYNLWLSTGRTEDFEYALKHFGDHAPYPNDPIARLQYSIILRHRHLLTGSMLDLESAITILEKLLIDIPKDDDVLERDVLSQLGNNLRIRARRTNSIDDCDRAIQLQEKALKIFERSGSESGARALYLICIASSFFRRYQIKLNENENVEGNDLDQAIQLYAEAEDGLPDDSSELGNLLGNRGTAIFDRYQKTQLPDDLNSSIAILQRAVELQTVDFQAQSLAVLGKALHFRAQITQSEADWTTTIETYERGAHCSHSPLSFRIMAADDGGNCIFHRDMNRASRLFELAVNLLPSVSPRFLIRQDQQFMLAQFDGLVWSAVSTCLETQNNLYRAIELSEIGRGVIANLQLDISSDISALQHADSHLAKRLSDLRDEISSTELSLDSVTLPSGHRDTIRNLAGEFNSLLAEIRELEGFDSFLRCPSETELRSLAIAGPIVIFSVSAFRSDALIITESGFRCLRLQNLSLKDVTTYAQQFIEAISTGGLKRYAESTSKMKQVLEWLWDVAVSPVLDDLGFMEMPAADDKWPRIWWVRGGLLSLFPLHAAGYHDIQPRRSAIDRVISSYTPLLKSLLSARNNTAAHLSSEGQKILVVGMPQTPDQHSLPQVEQELIDLAKVFPIAPSTIFQRNPNRHQILPVLKETEIFHYSGHGASLSADPSLSALLLNDWQSNPLTVAHLRSLGIQKGRFAYLSACHSGTSINSGLQLLDESLHISTGFQLAGFRSVVATLWYAHADHSATVAAQLYLLMQDENGRIHSDWSATALHHSVRSLRDDLRKIPGVRKLAPDDPLVWAAFIHTGE